MVALVVSSVVLVAASSIFAAVGDGGREVRAAREALDRSMNGRRWLAATFLSLEISQESAAPFEGRPDRLTFNAWGRVPNAWFENQRVRLERTEGAFTATVSNGSVIVLADSVTDVAFD